MALELRDEFIDAGHAAETRHFGTHQLVDRIVVLGDTDGDESGTRSSVEAYFNVVRVRLSNPVPRNRIAQQIEPSDFTLIPPHVRGDADFDGHGPHISVTLQIRRTDAGGIESRALMHAAEVENAKLAREDYTLASGWSAWTTVYMPEPGKRVRQILSPMQRTVDFTDVDHNVDLLSYFLGDHRLLLVIVGDTDTVEGDGTGGEAGSRTLVEVHFSFLDVELE